MSTRSTYLGTQARGTIQLVGRVWVNHTYIGLRDLF